MLHKTRGIVLRTTKYSETSLVVKIYTELFGLQSYMVNGVRSAKGKSKAAMYQHGNLLEMVVYQKDSASLQRISESSFLYIYEQIPFNIVKCSLLIFYVEVLNKTLKEQENNEPLFDFLIANLIDLDQTDRKLSNHHIWFLLGLSSYLGFFPSVSNEIYFDLQEGLFTNTVPSTQYMNIELSNALRSIILPELINYDQIVLTPAVRKQLLQQLLFYYRLHMQEFGELRSYHIMEELFRG